MLPCVSLAIATFTDSLEISPFVFGACIIISLYSAGLGLALGELGCSVSTQGTPDDWKDEGSRPQCERDLTGKESTGSDLLVCLAWQPLLVMTPTGQPYTSVSIGGN